MSRVKASLDHKRIRRLIWLVLTVFVLLGYLLQSVAGSAYYSMVMQAYGAVSSPPVILKNGTAGTSTIYTNKTSAKVNVESPLFDYVDNDDCNVDSGPDKGMHSNFPAQQAGPDSLCDKLKEENTEGIEDYVDNISDVDNSVDSGTHSNFNNMKLKDGNYDVLSEVCAVTYENSAESYSGIGQSSHSFDYSLQTASGNDRLVVVTVSAEDAQTGYATSVKFNNQEMKDVANLTVGTGYSEYVGLWYFLDSDLPSSTGDCSVAVTFSEAMEREIYIAVAEYTGVKQSAPDDYDTDSLTSSGSISVTLTAAADGSVVVAGAGQSGTNSWDDTNNIDNLQTQLLTSSGSALGHHTNVDSGDITVGWNNLNTREGMVGAVWQPAGNDYGLDLEVQWSSVADFLPTEKLCIYTGALDDEDLRVDYWNGTGWENLATDLTAYSCNEYTVSLTSTTFTIRFRDETTEGDTTQDQWQIDASLLRVEGAGSKEDAVDNDTSDVDSSADLGNLVNFDNMKATDSTYANLTESTGGITYINRAEASATSGTSAQVNKPTNTAENDFMIALLVSTIASDNDGSTMSSAPSGWTNEYDYIQSATSGQHVYIYWKVAGASEPSSYTWTWTSSCGWVAQITTFREVDTSSPIHVEGTVNQETSTSPMSPSVTTTVNNCMIWLYDMSDDDDVPASGGAPSGTTWIDQTEIASPGDGIGISTAYFVQASAGATGNKDWTLDASEENSGQQYALKPVPPNQLDQEVQWTGVPYLLPNENLSIYGGTMGAEDIKVDVWNGTGWQNVFNDLSSGWNNVSITDWLTSSNFTIRFKGGNETGDPSQDTWQIDVALIHIWHEDGETYQLDLEVQWTSVDYTRTNEELCIKTGDASWGAEDIKVYVWNATGSSWHLIVSDLTANSWHNFSVTDYLTSSTFTVRFLGGNETGDTTQDSWNIDATLLHVWTNESNYDYVLRVFNKVASNWTINLQVYDSSNIARLLKTTISFHDGSSSNQIIVNDGVITQPEGPPYNLAGNATIYISMNNLQATTTEISNLYVHLKILVPNTSTYMLYIIIFELPRMKCIFHILISIQILNIYIYSKYILQFHTC